VEQLPQRCVLDGELVVPTAAGLDFDLLGQRIHPADSRVVRLSHETPAHLVLFDILALDQLDLRLLAFSARRETLEQLLDGLRPPLHLTPATTDPEVAADWFARFDGAGFDGVVAKGLGGTYEHDKRVQVKVKHHRSVDCVVAGYGEHKQGGVGSLKLGLFDHADPPQLHHVGVCSAFAASDRRSLLAELRPLEIEPGEDHPWNRAGEGGGPGEGGGNGDNGARVPNAPSRWSGGRQSAPWVPLRCERVVEVTCENVTGWRFRHPARFLRWRPDKDPADCTVDQLEQPPPDEFALVFGQQAG